MSPQDAAAMATWVSVAGIMSALALAKPELQAGGAA